MCTTIHRSGGYIYIFLKLGTWIRTASPHGMGATTHTTARQLPSRAGEESPFSSQSATNPIVLDSRRDNDARGTLFPAESSFSFYVLAIVSL